MMKKYYIVGLLGLLFTLLLGGYLFKYSGIIATTTGSNSVWNYLPNEFDQILYTRYNQDVLDFTDSVYKGLLPTEQKEFLEIIDEFVLYQYATGGQDLLYIVFSKNPGISDERIKNLSLFVGDEEFDLEKLGTTVYLYGDEKSMAFAKQNKEDSFEQNPKFSEYIKALKKGDSNMAYFTNLQKELMKQGQMGFNNFSEYLKYGVLMGFASENNYSGKFDVLLEGSSGLFQDFAFQPKFEQYFGEDPYVLAEMGSLFSLVGVTEEQVNFLLKTVVAGSGTGYSNMLTEDDYRKVIEVLNGNIGLVVAPADNLLGFGIALIIDNPEIFGLIQKFTPYIKETLEGFDLLSGGVNIVENDDSMEMYFHHQYSETLAETKLAIQKKDDNLILSLLDPILTPKGSNYDLTYNNKSVFYFYINSGKIVDQISKFAFGMGPQFAQLAEGLEYFQSKSIEGRLDLFQDKISFIFNIGPNDQ